MNERIKNILKIVCFLFLINLLVTSHKIEYNEPIITEDAKNIIIDKCKFDKNVKIKENTSNLDTIETGFIYDSQLNNEKLIYHVRICKNTIVRIDTIAIITQDTSL